MMLLVMERLIDQKRLSLVQRDEIAGAAEDDWEDGRSIRRAKAMQAMEKPRTC